MNVLYLALMVWTPPPHCSTATEWQVFIKTDNPSKPFMLVVRGVDTEPNLDLRDWAQIQLLWNETVDLESLTKGVVIRREHRDPDNDMVVSQGGWGRLEGFALGGWVGDHVELLIPAVLSGRYGPEWYRNKRVCY